MLKKLLILLIIILSSSSLIYEANCYSSAAVVNSTSIKIVDSEDALISIPSSLTLKDNLADNEIEEASKTIETKIKNNLGEKIWVKVDNGDINSQGIFSDFGVSIDPGQEIAATINLNRDYNGKDVVFHARWHGNDYTAEIRSSIIDDIKS